MSVLAVRSECFENFEHAWRYVGKSVILARQVLNIVARGDSKVQAVVVHMKLLSILSASFTLMDIESVSRRLFKCQDVEGAFLDILSLGIMVGDAFDSFATFTNALYTIAFENTIKAFSATALPLAFGITSSGTVLRTIKVAKTFFLHQSLTKFDSLESLQKLLEEKLGASKETLLRAAPQGAIYELERIFSLLQSSHPDRHQILLGLENAQNILKDKMRDDLLGILANIVILSALSLFAMAVSITCAFALLAVGFSIRLAALVYKDSQSKKEIV